MKTRPVILTIVAVTLVAAWAAFLIFEGKQAEKQLKLFREQELYCAKIYHDKETAVIDGKCYTLAGPATP